MPLRDHFHPPLQNNPNAESITASWTTMILQRLNATVLPAGYRAEQVLAGDVSFMDADLFEVKVLDENGRLAAAIELVSRSNKDRPEVRRAFAIKCASYLQAGLSVVFVDIVTNRRADLHSELVHLLDLPDSLHWSSRKGPAAVSYRVVGTSEGARIEAWLEELSVGNPLPTVPLWLSPDLAVPLELEPTYEAAWACHR